MDANTSPGHFGVLPRNVHPEKTKTPTTLPGTTPGSGKLMYMDEHGFF